MYAASILLVISLLAATSDQLRGVDKPYQYWLHSSKYTNHFQEAQYQGSVADRKRSTSQNFFFTFSIAKIKPFFDMLF